MPLVWWAAETKSPLNAGLAGGVATSSFEHEANKRVVTIARLKRKVSVVRINSKVVKVMVALKIIS